MSTEMPLDAQAKMIRDLNGDLLRLLERIGDMSQWLISYVDTSTPHAITPEVYLLVGHRSVRNGNPIARIECCEVERLECIKESDHVISGGIITLEDGWRVSFKKDETSTDEPETYEVLTARDVLAALYGLVVCHASDAVESDQRT